jgi:hypothetical protein
MLERLRLELQVQLPKDFLFCKKGTRLVVHPILEEGKALISIHLGKNKIIHLLLYRFQLELLKSKI